MFSRTDPRYYLPFYRIYDRAFFADLQQHFIATQDSITFLHYYALAHKYNQPIDVPNPLFSHEHDFITYCDHQLEHWLQENHAILPHLFLNPQWNQHPSFRYRVFQSIPHIYKATLLDRYFFTYREFSVSKTHFFDWDSLFIQHVTTLFQHYSFAWDLSFQALREQSFHMVAEFEWALLALIEQFMIEQQSEEVLILC